MALLRGNIFLYKLAFGSAFSATTSKFNTSVKKPGFRRNTRGKDDFVVESPYRPCDIDNRCTLKQSPSVIDEAETSDELTVERKKVLVLDLDETLIHSGFENNGTHSFTVEITQDGAIKTVYVSKRPFVDEFLVEVSKMYELVVFTAGLCSYANPVIDALDVHGVLGNRLFRDSCVYWSGCYIKDLSTFNRLLKDIVIIDNSPASYCLQPNNAIPIESWFDDKDDIQLLKLIPLLKKLSSAEDVTTILNGDLQEKKLMLKVLQRSLKGRVPFSSKYDIRVNLINSEDMKIKFREQVLSNGLCCYNQVA